MNEVDPVKTKHEILTIETLLNKHFGQIYADVWRVGLNLSLRISDLLKIQYVDLNLDRRELILTEQKTKKVRHIRLNNTVLGLIKKRHNLNPNDVYLFQVHSNRTKGQVRPISRVSISRAFKEVGDIIGIHLNTHSMRKSRGYVMFTDGVPIEKISKVLNHSSPAVTLAYIGVTKQDILNTYDQYEL